ncbi:hypothetical protein AUC68_03480 [Methyloceanibacter methanicus]|uniref:Thioredoxin domain-containing protein n=1 Tax=Methyloceanibacter methanicus TaxID=1774968 RepID=A0A1E3W2Y9_9HYPH|nr:hypothetical protein AUC68_03480 [Methyloceanibacter methanicus]
MTNGSPHSLVTKIGEGATPARVRIVLAVLLLAVFALMQSRPAQEVAPGDILAWRDDGRLHVFVHPDCPHCHAAQAFLRDHPEIETDIHDVSTPANERLFRVVAREYGIPERGLGVPLFVFGDRHMLGFDRPETTGADLLALVGGAAHGNQTSAGYVDLPVFGKIDPNGYSLAGLAVIMGLADGFNPCAMWVLIYLISLIAGLRDPAKIWWLVGTFVLASGILYFLLMTAWLNVFLVVGYVRPLTEFVALLAIGFGISHLYELVWTRGVIECEVGDVEQRQRTMSRIRDVVAAPIGVVSLLLIVGLAFAVTPSSSSVRPRFRPSSPMCLR